MLQRPRRAYSGREGGSRSSRAVSVVSVRLAPADYQNGYIAVWAMAVALRKRSGTVPLFGRALLLLRRELEAECKRKGLDWRKHWPTDPPGRYPPCPGVDDGRLGALEKKRRRKPQVDSVRPRDKPPR